MACCARACVGQAKISTSESQIKDLTDRVEHLERLNEQLTLRARDLEVSASAAAAAAAASAPVVRRRQQRRRWFHPAEGTPRTAGQRAATPSVYLKVVVACIRAFLLQLEGPLNSTRYVVFNSVVLQGQGFEAALGCHVSWLGRVCKETETAGAACGQEQPGLF